MTIKLGSNQLSFAVQARLNDASAAVSSSSERLASGLRINKASDDAAGLAISSSLNLKSRVFTQGVRNLNDGLSAVNIAESAIGSLSDILVQIEELSVQSMNGTYSDVQRQSMQQQVTALQGEWNRIVEGTTFNGQQLLTGLGTRMVLQGRDGAEGTLSVQVGKELLNGGFADYAGSITRVSTSSASGEGNATVSGNSASISADGRYIVFSSDASNLVAGDSNGVRDIFLKDSLTGVTTRISTDSSGQEGNGSSDSAHISADGRFVVFSSNASNLVAGDTNGTRDVFLKDLSTGGTTRVSTSSSGQQSSGNSYALGVLAATISADGRYVVFQSSASDLVTGDSNGVMDIFCKDTVSGTTTRVSTSSAGQQATGYSTGGSISADGRYVLFRSGAANLVSGDTNSRVDTFLKDLTTGVTTRVNTNSAGQQSTTGSPSTHGMSADGRYVVFESSATGLVSGDSDGFFDIFLKDLSTGVTTIVSANSSGQKGNNHSFTPSISADGRYISFHSLASNLVSGDDNGLRDVFVKDMLTGNVVRASTTTSGQQGNARSSNATISADGRYVVFNSDATNFADSDGNAVTDYFVRDLTRTGIQTLSGMIVNNRASAAITLSLVAKYKDELTEYKSTLGASTARISSFISTLDSGRTNYVQAASRITDTDVAEESAALVAATTRQKVSAALLSQANIAPQIALALLRNV